MNIQKEETRKMQEYDLNALEDFKRIFEENISVGKRTLANLAVAVKKSVRDESLNALMKDKEQEKTIMAFVMCTCEYLDYNRLQFIEKQIAKKRQDEKNDNS